MIAVEGKSPLGSPNRFENEFLVGVTQIDTTKGCARNRAACERAGRVSKLTAPLGGHGIRRSRTSCTGAQTRVGCLDLYANISLRLTRCGAHLPYHSSLRLCPTWMGVSR
ncbi:hypothetical protein FA13DRAFT_1525939 [Coprinellus micaceus]|uniref:Uncharacterized protein n=1 Tax=Coprinellus micaceus TaxID=71717 RepID=A0A4Y7SJE9_COPMI|nr:hypothetical protein FA13DRAFT_1525939 [Coprinellus micaceus]